MPCLVSWRGTHGLLLVVLEGNTYRARYGTQASIMQGITQPLENHTWLSSGLTPGGLWGQYGGTKDWMQAGLIQCKHLSTIPCLWPLDQMLLNKKYALLVCNFYNQLNVLMRIHVVAHVKGPGLWLNVVLYAENTICLSSSPAHKTLGIHFTKGHTKSSQSQTESRRVTAKDGESGEWRFILAQYSLFTTMEKFWRCITK